MDRKKYGKDVKIARIVANMKQEDLAARLNVSQAMVSKIERGAVSCSVELLLKIRELLGVVF